MSKQYPPKPYQQSYQQPYQQSYQQQQQKIFIKDATVQDEQAANKLHSIFSNGDYLNIVDYILSKGSNFTMTNDNDDTLLHIIIKHDGIAESEKYDLVKLCIEHNTPIDAQNKQNKTPLHIACELQTKKIISLLLQKGANANIIDKNFRTPLFFAVIGLKSYCDELIPKSSKLIEKNTTITNETFDDLEKKVEKILKDNNTFKTMFKPMKNYKDIYPEDYKKFKTDAIKKMGSALMSSTISEKNKKQKIIKELMNNRNSLIEEYGKKLRYKETVSNIEIKINQTDGWHPSGSHDGIVSKYNKEDVITQIKNDIKRDYDAIERCVREIKFENEITKVYDIVYKTMRYFRVLLHYLKPYVNINDNNLKEKYDKIISTFYSENKTYDKFSRFTELYTNNIKTDNMVKIDLPYDPRVVKDPHLYALFGANVLNGLYKEDSTTPAYFFDPYGNDIIKINDIVAKIKENIKLISENFNKRDFNNVFENIISLYHEYVMLCKNMVKLNENYEKIKVSIVDINEKINDFVYNDMLNINNIDDNMKNYFIPNGINLNSELTDILKQTNGKIQSNFDTISQNFTKIINTTLSLIEKQSALTFFDNKLKDDDMITRKLVGVQTFTFKNIAEILEQKSDEGEKIKNLYENILPYIDEYNTTTIISNHYNKDKKDGYWHNNEIINESRIDKSKFGNFEYKKKPVAQIASSTTASTTTSTTASTLVPTTSVPTGLTPTGLTPTGSPTGPQTGLLKMTRKKSDTQYGGADPNTHPIVISTYSKEFIEMNTRNIIKDVIQQIYNCRGHGICDNTDDIYDTINKIHESTEKIVSSETAMDIILVLIGNIIKTLIKNKFNNTVSKSINDMILSIIQDDTPQGEYQYIVEDAYDIDLGQLLDEMLDCPEITKNNIYTSSLIDPPIIDDNHYRMVNPLYVANNSAREYCYHADPEIIDILIRNNAKINKKDILGQTPIYYAIRAKNHSIIERLLTHNASINRVININGESAFEFAYNLYKSNIQDYKVICEQLTKNIFGETKMPPKNTSILFEIAITMLNHHFFLLSTQYTENWSYDDHKKLLRIMPNLNLLHAHPLLLLKLEQKDFQIFSDFKKEFDSLKKREKTLRAYYRNLAIEEKKINKNKPPTEYDATRLETIEKEKNKCVEDIAKINKQIDDCEKNQKNNDKIVLGTSISSSLLNPINIEGTDIKKIYENIYEISVNDIIGPKTKDALSENYTKRAVYQELWKKYTTSSQNNDHILFVENLLKSQKNILDKNANMTRNITKLNIVNKYYQIVVKPHIINFLELPNDYTNKLKGVVIDIVTHIIKRVCLVNMYLVIMEHIKKFTQDQTIVMPELEKYIFGDFADKLVKNKLDDYMAGDSDMDINEKSDVFDEITNIINIDNKINTLNLDSISTNKTQSGFIDDLNNKIINHYKNFIGEAIDEIYGVLDRYLLYMLSLSSEMRTLQLFNEKLKNEDIVVIVKKQ